jgi:hypothetical protein
METTEKPTFSSLRATPDLIGGSVAIPQSAGLLRRPANCGTLRNDRWKRLPSRNFKKADTIYFFFISAQGAETTTQNSK